MKTKIISFLTTVLLSHSAFTMKAEEIIVDIPLQKTTTDVGFETTQNWYLNFIFGTKYGDYDGYFIAWSRFIGEGWRFYEPIDEVTISMFQSHPDTQFVNDIELLTDIAPNN